jgi:hypothetical protein
MYQNIFDVIIDYYATDYSSKNCSKPAFTDFVWSSIGGGRSSGIQKRRKYLIYAGSNSRYPELYRF